MRHPLANGPGYDEMSSRGLRILEKHPVQTAKVVFAGAAREVFGPGADTVGRYLHVRSSHALSGLLFHRPLGTTLIMRILLISLSPPEAAYLHKALRESAHSLQATDDLRDGLYLASQDAFDVVLIVALDAPSTDELAEILPEFTRLTNPPTLMAVLGRAGAAERVRMLRAGADAC